MVGWDCRTACGYERTSDVLGPIYDAEQWSSLRECLIVGDQDCIGRDCLGGDEEIHETKSLPL